MKRFYHTPPTRTMLLILALTLLPLRLSADTTLKDLQSLLSLSRGYALVMEDNTVAQPTVSSVPDDYHGTPTYACEINTYFAKIDKKTGTLTWYGRPCTPRACGKVTISFPSADGYEAATLSYDVYPQRMDIYNISDWRALTAFTYDGATPLDIRLVNDLTLTESADDMVKLFSGTFDGQGHTITLDGWKTARYLSNRYVSSPFYLLKDCTFSNLRITGTITPDYGTDRFGALAYRVTGGTPDSHNCVAFVDCHSDVAWAPGSKLGDGGMYCANGFVTEVDVYTDVTFTDCSYTGSFSGSTYMNSSGFVGMQSATASTISLNGCLSAISGYDSSKDASEMGYFVYGDSPHLSVKNSCAKLIVHNGSALLPATGGETIITADELMGGKAAYLLNGGRTGEEVQWLQTTGTDKVPVTKTFSYYPLSLEVLHVAESTYNDLADYGVGTLCYPANVNLPNIINAPYRVHAYTVNMMYGNELQLSDPIDDVLPAHTPAILRVEGTGVPAALTLPEAYYNADEKIETLTGVYQDTQADTSYFTCYMLDKKEGTVAFYPFTGTVPAFRCYLHAGEWQMITLPFGDEPTGIGRVSTETTGGDIYNLAGQKVQTLPKRGVYIRDGRKFVVR